MTFRTVFDVAHQGYAAWSFPAFCLIFVGAGALLVFRPALIKNRRFSYSDNMVTSFHNTVSDGGPIREGLYVRVTYFGNLILRLEIAQ